jgi:hypothetical protein
MLMKNLWTKRGLHNGAFGTMEYILGHNEALHSTPEDIVPSDPGAPSINNPFGRLKTKGLRTLKDLCAKS